MKLYNETREIFKGSEQWKMFEWALAFLSLISGCFAISVVPFIRKDFGERYLGWLNLFFGYTVVANFFFLGNVISMLTRHGGSRMMGFFWLAFMVVSVYRRREITARNNAGVEWHSMYIGTSLLPLPFSSEKIYKFFEPAIVFGIGYFLWSTSGLVGLWLMISALALFVNNHIVFYNERRSILDMRDAQIEAKYLGAALSGKPVSETAGLVVAESSVRLMRQTADLAGAFESLSPELKEVLDTEHGATAPEPR